MIIYDYFLVLNSTTRNLSTKSEFEFVLFRTLPFNQWSIQLVSLNFWDPKDEQRLVPTSPTQTNGALHNNWGAIHFCFIPWAIRHHLALWAAGRLFSCYLMLDVWTRQGVLNLTGCFCSWFCMCWSTFSGVSHTELYVMYLCIVFLFAKSMLQLCFPWVRQFNCDFKVEYPRVI